MTDGPRKGVSKPPPVFLGSPTTLHACQGYGRRSRLEEVQHRRESDGFGPRAVGAQTLGPHDDPGQGSWRVVGSSYSLLLPSGNRRGFPVDQKEELGRLWAVETVGRPTVVPHQRGSTVPLGTPRLTGLIGHFSYY